MSQVITSLQEYFDQLDRSSPLSSFRVKSWEKFNTIGLPGKKTEAFHYISLRELSQAQFSLCAENPIAKSEIVKAILPECAHSHLVFVDGRFSSILSDLSGLPSDILAIPLEEAMRSHASFLNHHFMRAVKEELDPFALLNLSLHPGGLFFYLPPQVELEVPLQCLFVYTSDLPKISSPRVHFIAARHSKLQVLITSFAEDPLTSHLIAPAIEMSLEEGAELSLCNFSETLPFAWHFETVRAYVKKNARVRTLSLAGGAKIFRQSYQIFLKEENSQAELKGLNLLSEQRSVHTHVTIEHEAPHTHSKQLFKGVLKDISRSSFEGKIFVRPIAQKTEAYQLNRHLLLNPGAVANSRPNLEIFADDVKASHGATVAQIDPEQLFYLKTRGIDEKLAQHLLIKAFCEELIEEIPYLSLQQKMQHQIESFIKTKRGEE